MPGTLIPAWFHPEIPTCHDAVIVSIIWGLSLGLSLFGVIRAGNQTHHQWKRTGRVTTYMILIWLELIASTIIGGIGWGYVHLSIPPSFEFFFFLLFLWVFQIHCIMQIIINRIALLAVSPTIVRRLKWGVFILLALINVSVFCIWIPARLQISHRWSYLNNIWDRVEKGIFALVDAGLNFYFIYLVRSSLISYGLTKYVVLYRVNLIMVAISVGMDVSIPD
ncbi:Fc.00g030910.m01.CDS01 [Cosmosporella sp. VM-42]